MSITSQEYAKLTEHGYGEEFGGKKGQMQHLVDQEVILEGVTYKVLDYVDQPSGYQGAIYQRVDTGAIVVAHRGTEFDRELVQDGLLADGGMVMGRTNRQAADAIALTQNALDLAKDPDNLLKYDRTPEVTVTGHSLGGTLAQITAYRFNLRGETFNAFGAVSLGYRISEGGLQVVNHVKASDPVSAASQHFGQVRMYASPEEVRLVGGLGGYANDRNPLDNRSLALAMGGSFGAHRMHHFTSRDGDGKPDHSILGNPNAQRVAQAYGPMFDKYRNDIYMTRGTVSVASTIALEVRAEARETGGQVASHAMGTAAGTIRTSTHVGADVSSTATRTAGAVAAAGVHYAGDTAARARDAVSALDAGMDHLQGQAQKQGATMGAELLRRAGSLLPDGAQRWMDSKAERVEQAGDNAYQRNLAEAALARRDGREDSASIRETAQGVALETVRVSARASDFQRNTIAGAGKFVGVALDAAGQLTEERTSRAPGQGGANEIEHNGSPRQPQPASQQNPGTPQSAAPGAVIPAPDLSHLHDPRNQTYSDPNLQPSAQAQANRLDRMPSHHPDYALFASIRDKLPAGTSEDMAAHITLEAKMGGIRAGEIEKFAAHNDRAFVVGKFGHHAAVDMAQPPPSMHETLQRSQTFDQQLIMVLAQQQDQQRQVNERTRDNSGPVIS